MNKEIRKIAENEDIDELIFRDEVYYVSERSGLKPRKRPFFLSRLTDQGKKDIFGLKERQGVVNEKNS